MYTYSSLHAPTHLHCGHIHVHMGKMTSSEIDHHQCLGKRVPKFRHIPSGSAAMKGDLRCSASALTLLDLYNVQYSVFCHIMYAQLPGLLVRSRDDEAHFYLRVSPCDPVVHRAQELVLRAL